jgi:hypothetical protein
MQIRCQKSTRNSFAINDKQKKLKLRKSDGMPAKHLGISVSGVPAHKNINIGL